MRTTTIRFTGLASGLDTESIVGSMVMPYKLKVDTAKQNQTMMEWKKEAWRDMNAKLFGFYDKQVSKMRLESSFLNKKSITVSNSNIIEIAKNATLPEGTHKIEKISDPAQSARVNTKELKRIDGEAVGKDTKLKDLDPRIDPSKSKGVLEVSDGKTSSYIVIDGDVTIGDLEKQLKTKMPNTNVSFDKGTGAFFITSKKTGANQKINMKAFEYPNPEGGKVTTEDIEQNKGKLIKNTSILGELGFKSDSSSPEKIHVQGQNTTAIYNGVPVDSETNTITVNGFSFTVKLKSDTPVILNSSFDAEGVTTYIKEFVDEYNKLIEDIQKQLDMPSAKSYKPLTEEQKKDMSDYEIEQWEKKIKDSLFRKDPDLEKLLGDMRSVFGGVVEGSPFETLSSIGIKTGDWKEKGKLNLDEDKLRAALAKDSQGVIDLFSKNGDTEASIGLADRMYDMMTKQTKSSEMRTAYSFYNDKVLTKNITNQKDEVSKLQNRMYRMEDMYYKRFAAMEKMMSQLNSQSSWITSQLGGM